jgi:hypothetical protein
MKARRGGALTALGLLLVAGAPRSAGATDPTLSECIAANEDAIHSRREHKLRQARAHSLACAAQSCPGELREACQLRVRDLNAAIPSVVFLAKDEAGGDLVDVRVRMDGEIVGQRLDGTAIAVDPGQHTFTFEATGRPAVDRSLVVSEGQKDRREVITLPSDAAASTVAPPEPAPGATAQTARGAQVAIEVPPRPAASRGREQRTVGIAIGALGLLGLGVGAVTGGLAAAKWSDARSACNGKPRSCTTDPASPGTRDASTATTFATAADVGLIAGGVLVAGGLLVFLTAPAGRTREPRGALRAVEILPWAAPSSSGLTLRGQF